MTVSKETVRVSTEVLAPPLRAFELFTDDIDRWWLRNPRFRRPHDKRFYFEPGPSGRLMVERLEGPDFQMGRVLEWRPGELLLLEWRGFAFAEDEWTTLEVRFEPSARGTQVSLEHRGFELLASDHPARHGLQGGAFRDLWSVSWGDLLFEIQRLSRAESEQARRQEAS